RPAARQTTGTPPALPFAEQRKASLKTAESWACRFSQTRAAGLMIHSSADGRVRGFTPPHSPSSLLQARSPGGHTSVQSLPGHIERLHTLRLNGYGHAYLLFTEQTNGDHTEKSLVLLHFAAEQLQALPIIQTAPAADPTHHLNIAYSGQHTNNYFFYEPGSHTISQPQISSHTHTPTNRRLKYRFNGQLFLPHS
ncbi:hypothetical protein, partial [Eikenella corrodens]|uniref:hypothetical protein n=1 Tax=Eikenella corrodens TaxID=539 RepID=UPI0014301ED5